MVSAEFHCIRQVLQGFSGKSTVSKTACSSVCSVASVYAVLVVATSSMTLDFIRHKKRPYINCKAWIFLTSPLYKLHVEDEQHGCFCTTKLWDFRGSKSGRFKDSIFLVQLTKSSFRPIRVVFRSFASVWNLRYNKRHGLWPLDALFLV